MKIFVLSLVICVVMLITVKAQTLNTLECDDDEECRPIHECERESKYLKDRQMKLLKFCGIWLKSTEHCCKITESTMELPTIRHTPSTTTPRSNVTDRNSGDIESHKNFNMINNKRFCGKAVSDRIFEGERATVNQFPWVALLEYRSKDDDECESFRCGGSLISEQYVLTAANCILQEEELFSVRLGEHTISTSKDCSDEDDPDSCSEAEDIPIESVKVHEGYDPVTKINDIALIRLSRPIELSKALKNIKPICLPIKECQQIDNMEEDLHSLTLAGWGYSQNSDNDAASDVLIQAIVPYLPQDICKMEYSEKKIQNPSSKIDIHSTQLCAGSVGGLDLCRTENGSALTGVGEIEEGKYRIFQHGILSFGVECGTTKTIPGVYTRVSKYINWILDNISA